jgi:hypothetical protein
MPLALVYSARTGRVRRWAFDPDRTFVDLRDNVLRPGIGEAALELESTEKNDLGALQSVVSAMVGKSPAGDRYVLVDAKGDVTGHLDTADPDCGDAIAGHTLIAHDKAAPGWRYVAGEFVAPVIEPFDGPFVRLGD